MTLTRAERRIKSDLVGALVAAYQESMRLQQAATDSRWRVGERAKRLGTADWQAYRTLIESLGWEQ